MPAKTSGAMTSCVLDRLARNLHTLRMHWGWSFAQLAKRSGVSIATLKHVERRHADPSLTDLLRLANTTRVTLAELVDHDLAPPLQNVPSSAGRYRDPERIGERLCSRIRAWRISRGFSSRAFAEHAGMSKGALYYLEAGRAEPRLKMTERLAKAFGVSFSGLVLPSPVISIVPAGRRTNDPRVLILDGDADALQWSECRLARQRSLALPANTVGSTAFVYLLGRSAAPARFLS